MALLIDLSGTPEDACDTCLNDLFKAISEDPGDGSLWDKHPNPWLTGLVETIYERLSAILLRIQDMFSGALFGRAIGELAKADTPWLRWDSGLFAAARLRLETIPADDYTLDDWLLLAEYIIQRFLPDDVIRTEAEHAAIVAQIAGKIAAAMEAEGEHGANRAPEDIVPLIPTDFAHVPPKILTRTENAILRVAAARAAEHISDVAAGTRAAMKRRAIEHIQAQMLGQKEGTAQALQTRLFDQFAALNRDCRRIAVTEAGEAFLQGYVLAQAPGTHVKRIEAYRGCCAFCREWNGKVFRVISAADAVPTRDGLTCIWPGKTQIGRSASPRRRVGNTMIERSESERWWPTAGLFHPNCRGAWTPAREKDDLPPNVSPEFATWLRDRLAVGRRGEPHPPS